MSKKLLIIIIAAVVVIAGGGAAAYFFLFTGEKVAPEIPYSTGDSFITNVDGNKMHLRTNIVIILNSETMELPYGEKTKEHDTIEFLSTNNYKIRDIIISILRSQSAEDLSGPDAQNNLRKKILEELGSTLQISEYLTTIYFNDFVVQ